MSDKIKDYLSEFHSNGFYIPTRTIDITGDITEETYEKVVKSLHAFDSQPGTINIILNSEGGEFRSGLGIYDTIRGCNSYVRIMVYGSCMSIASIILQSGDERLLSPNSLVMLHYGSNGGADNPIAIEERWTEQHKKDKNTMENIYLQKIKENKPRFTRKKLQEMLKIDTILSVKETIELGLADRIEECFRIKE